VDGLSQGEGRRNIAESLPENPEEDVRTRPGEDVIRSEGVSAIVDLSDRPTTRRARVWSPRVADPEQATFLAKHVMPEE
jgi:hypothetical protein